MKERLGALFEHQSHDFTIDDQTYEDLALDDVFKRINRTRSLLGEEILYGMLRSPKLDPEELSDMEERLTQIREAGEQRVQAQRSFDSLPKNRKISIFRYLYRIGDIPSMGKGSLIRPTILILLALCTLIIHPALGILLILIAYGVNTVDYFKKTKEMKPYLICFAYIARVIRAEKDNPFLDPSVYLPLMKLTRGLFILGSIEGQSASGGSGSPLDIFTDLLKMGFHFDIMKFHTMVSFVKDHEKELERYLREFGTVDVMLSILILREEASDDLPVCIPEHGTDKELRITGGVHPLLMHPVPNSIRTAKNILLTGSNASGKSTFLKCIAINALLSQTIHTVFAKDYRAPLFKVISSMSHHDDILSGDSYYIAEIRAMKRILDLYGEGGRTVILAFVDEILSGTNTNERLSAGTQILRYLTGDNILTFAATHDMELTYLLEDLYVNYHFSEDVSSRDLTFSYELKEGRSDSRNAIRLLSIMDFPKEITDRAEEMAKAQPVAFDIK